MVSKFSVLNIYVGNKTFIRSIARWSASQWKLERCVQYAYYWSLFLETISEKSPFYAPKILAKQKKKKKRANPNILGERKKNECNIFVWDAHYFYFMMGFQIEISTESALYIDSLTK